MSEKIDNIINNLIINGSNIEPARNYIKNNVIDILENNSNDEFIFKLEQFIEESMMHADIKNLSLGLKINDYELIINKGNTDFNNSVYDVASITKLFTLKLCYELNKERILDFDKNINEILPEFKNLNNYKIIDILKMHGFIETDGKLSETKSKREFIERLKTVKVKDYNLNLYTDIGFNILPLIIEKEYEHKYLKKLTFDELCCKYIFKPYQLLNTGFNIKNKILLGSDNDYLPSDQKAKILDGVSGAAGIFTDVKDMIKLSVLINNYNFFDKKFIEQILNYNFMDDLNRRRSYAGLYIHTKNNRLCFAPDYYSNYTLAHQGYTGSVIAFDTKNNINQVILIDAMDNSNHKIDTFFDYFHPLQDRISVDSLVLYIVNQLKD